MAKVTVLDIISTRKTLARLENYARRHMDNLPIAEANDSVREARDMLMNNVDEFDNCDVTMLTADTTEKEDRLQKCYENLDWAQKQVDEEKAKKKKNRDKWWLKHNRERVERYQNEIEEIEDFLNS